MRIIITQSATWRSGSRRKRPPVKLAKVDEWSISGNGDLTVYDTKARPILSLAAGEWMKITPAK